jgi:acyl-CoA thioester hydrolase
MTPFEHPLRVRYHETDSQRFVYNARYLEYIDVAMTEWFRSIGWPYENLIAAGCDPSVVKVEMEFHAPARFDDELTVGIELVRLGRSSFTLAFVIRELSEGTLILSAQLVYANVDIHTQRSRILPREVRDRMTEHETKEPAIP